MSRTDEIIAATAGHPGPIGVFDSGYGGLTVLRSLRKALPDADFIYLGDNARAPYGNRSFDLVYRFTLEAVRYLFARGCQLVILACNTASAKALRSIQQRDLPALDPDRRVLGVIRPTAEAVGEISKSGCIGLVGTPGTVASQSYDIELAKLHPGVRLYSRACPMWVPLVENLEADGPGADYFVKRDIDALMSLCPDIDTLILGCTHYPLLLNKIKQYTPEGVNVLPQGEIVAASLLDYLKRHPEIDSRITRGGTAEYVTTEEADKFNNLAGVFMGAPVQAHREVSLIL
ncbi:MAG: glutamate racemase [Muribaculaceae bacterium]|nr:glutamate racemase [Muribaculaceae bacterium]